MNVFGAWKDEEEDVEKHHSTETDTEDEIIHEQ